MVTQVYRFEELNRLLDFEFERIEQAFDNFEFNLITGELRRSEPERPRDGQLAFADGENWDPESGEGLYWYSDAEGAWLRVDNAPGRHSRLKWFYNS